MNPIDRVYTGTECREMDRIAIDELGIPGFELMKRAGSFAFEKLKLHFASVRRIKVVAGSGNNAGDSYVVAGLARREGFDVILDQVGDPDRVRGDAKLAWNWMVDQGVDLNGASADPPDLIVDGLLGTGAKGSVRGRYGKALADINREGCSVLALDVPSGIDSSTGSLLCKEPVEANLTCTFIGAKLGLFTGTGPAYAGRVEFSNLDLPAEVSDRVCGLPLLDPDGRDHYLQRRKSTLHKGQAGSVLVVAGDLGCGGAAILTGEAALRTGAGLVTVISRPEHVAAFLARCPEIMVHGALRADDLSSHINKADVVALGPGLTDSSWSKSMVDCVLDGRPEKLVVDAGALRLLGNRKLPSQCIITPHPGEAGALLDCSTQQVQHDRVGAICRLTRSLQCTAILKGAGSLVASNGEAAALLRCVNPALATAGSGDVLTGIVAASLAVIDNPINAAKSAAVLHCRAGRDAVGENWNRSIVASDLLGSIRPWGNS